jgi:predicted Fe-Mo cluster-binding NifX family protein
MKLVITSTGDTMSSTLDPRFGRARYFIAVDTESGDFKAHSNEQNLQAAQGAGIQAAQNVVDLGAEAVVTGNVGPKAFRVLNAAGIAVHLCGEASVAEALERFRKGELKAVDAANVGGHWA